MSGKSTDPSVLSAKQGLSKYLQLVFDALFQLPKINRLVKVKPNKFMAGLMLRSRSSGESQIPHFLGDLSNSLTSNL